ncbi:hypothetical protein JB92DRAFT_3138640 [Gautieria morchelliformis]|nr:hypothetical protein JB92DRAFT_3138640 [Gautieria morchelliformis]
MPPVPVGSPVSTGPDVLIKLNSRRTNRSKWLLRHWPLLAAGQTIWRNCGQVAAKQRDIRILQKNVTETAIAHQDAELKVKEQVSLPPGFSVSTPQSVDLGYRNSCTAGLESVVSSHLCYQGSKATAHAALSKPRRSKWTKVASYELEEFIPSKHGMRCHGERSAILGNASDLTASHIRNGSDQHVQNSVTWFSTSFHCTAPPAEDV